MVDAINELYVIAAFSDGMGFVVAGVLKVSYAIAKEVTVVVISRACKLCLV